MKHATSILPSAIVLLWGAVSALGAADHNPHIGYVYPAGGQIGTSIVVKIGGEYIYGAMEARVSGAGVGVQVVDSRDPLEGKEPGNKKQKRKNQTVLDEVVTLKVSLAADAEPGDRDIRLLTPDGLSNPLVFQVGQLPEVNEAEPNDKKSTAFALPAALPVLVNGQIMSGDVDSFTFPARKGQHLVFEAAARALIPYVADAVPGWFQATLAMYDEQDREIAFADDYRFNPDPVLLCEVPADGSYRLAIRDSIYRGRADFVYRIRIGELPFITNIMPLGAQSGKNPVSVAVSGRNLPGDALCVSMQQELPGIVPLAVRSGGLLSTCVPFVFGSVNEAVEDETATRSKKGQRVAWPVVMNGCIRVPGEADRYCFEGRKGQPVHIAVKARQLGTPLDAYLVLEGPGGKKIGENDDVKDRAQGLLTHQADPELQCDLPEDGLYTVKLFDTQGKGGNEYAYRLSLGPPDPDFDVRATPSSLTVRKGDSVAFAVHAIRRCGFSGEIRLAFSDASAAGCALDGGVIPAGRDNVRVTISADREAASGLRIPRITATAVANGAVIAHPVVPADDLMQAFIYQHLVPAHECVLVVQTSAAPFRVVAETGPQGVLELPVGKEVSFAVKVVRGPDYDELIRLQLEDPPKGITFRKPGIPPGKDSALVTVRTERSVEVGLQGNLIVTAVMQREAQGVRTGSAATNKVAGVQGGGKAAAAPSAASAGSSGSKGRGGPPRERIAVTLPAVPFKVVAGPDKERGATQ